MCWQACMCSYMWASQNLFLYPFMQCICMDYTMLPCCTQPRLDLNSHAQQETTNSLLPSGICPCKRPAFACAEPMLVQAPMLDLLHRYIDGKGKQAKLKSPNELQVSLSVSTPPLVTLSFCRPAFLQLHISLCAHSANVGNTICTCHRTRPCAGMIAPVPSWDCCCESVWCIKASVHSVCCATGSEVNPCCCNPCLV